MITNEILVSVCICTYKRPEVVDTIKSIFAQVGIGPNIEIVVCDDDEAGSAKLGTMSLADRAPFSMRYVHCGSRNISICRNICVTESRGEWVAFIDDDEIAEPNWLRELLRTQVEYSADVVKGNVRGVYPQATPSWIVEGDPFSRDFGPSGTQLTWFGTGNVMFRRNLVIDGKIWFEESYGRTGGEDTKFFRCLRERGALMVACQTAIVNEITPPSRVEGGYLKRRFRRQGQLEATYEEPRSTSVGRLIKLVKYAARAVKYSPYPFFRPISGKRSFEMFRKFWFFFGMVECTLGRQPFTIDQ